MMINMARVLTTKPYWDHNCAVLEVTGDGETCGRCWYYVGEKDVCPRHGDVSDVMQKYRETGKLTLETEMSARLPDGRERYQ